MKIAAILLLLPTLTLAQIPGMDKWIGAGVATGFGSSELICNRAKRNAERVIIDQTEILVKENKAIAGSVTSDCICTDNKEVPHNTCSVGIRIYYFKNK